MKGNFFDNPENVDNPVNVDNTEKIIVNPQNIYPEDIILGGPPEQNLSVNSFSLTNGEEKINISNPDFICNKLSRFIFPKFDPEKDPNWYVDSRSMPEKFLSIMCNSLSLLTELELNHWNELCGRNCLFKEKSKSGIYATDFDIKTEQRIFKAQMSKLDYIEKLGAENSKKVTRTDIQLN